MGEEEKNTDDLLHCLDEMVMNNKVHMEWLQERVKDFTTSWNDFPKESLEALSSSAVCLEEENEKVSVIRGMVARDKNKIDSTLNDIVAPLMATTSDMCDENEDGSSDDGDGGLGAEGEERQGGEGKKRRQRVGEKSEAEIHECLLRLERVPIEEMVNESLREAEKEVGEGRGDKEGLVEDMRGMIRRYEQNGFKRLANCESAATGKGDFQLLSHQTRRMCPLMQTEIREPVRNKHCGHVYDKRSVKVFLKKGQLKGCPVSGCVNAVPIKMKDLLDERPPLAITAGTTSHHHAHTTLQPDTCSTSADLMDID